MIRFAGATPVISSVGSGACHAVCGTGRVLMNGAARRTALLLPRVQITVRRLMLIVAVVSIALALPINHYRRMILRDRLAQAKYHEFLKSYYSSRIGDDLRRAKTCIRWEVAGERPPIDPGDNTGMAGGAFDATHRWRVSIMTLQEQGYRGPSGPLVLSWFREAAWWVAEAVRDVGRSALQDRLKRENLHVASRTTVWGEASWEPVVDLLVGLALCVKAFWMSRSANRMKCNW
jgi:hypothetical protein